MKLSPVQQTVIDMMRAGWALKSCDGYSPRSWLSKVEHGSLKTKTVKSPTIVKLIKLKLIECERAFPISTWRLTERGE